MRKASVKDKDLAVNIISETFEKNPGVNWLLRKGGNHKKKVKRLAEYEFIKSCLREGAFISDNEKGAALCYNFDQNKFSFVELFYQLKFALLSTEIKRLPKVLKRESYRKSIRLESGDYLYFCFLGVLPEGKDAVFDLRDDIYKYTDSAGKEIYPETAVERNKYVYERFGFEAYHYWEDENEEIKFWFMKREPKQQNK